MKDGRPTWLCALALVTGAGSPALAQVPDPRIAAAFARLEPHLRSVVYISITCPSGEKYGGTGVLVRDTGEVLTAAHVGEQCPNVAAARMGRLRSPYSVPTFDLSATRIKRIVDSRTAPTPAQIGDADFQDLALWKIGDMTNSGLVAAELADAFPAPGDPIEIVGFSALPFLHPIVGNHGENNGPGLTRFRTSLISVGASPQDLPYRLHYPGFTLEGSSGGPVFNAAGELIGIHSTREAKLVRDTLTTGCSVPDPLKNCVPAMIPGPNDTATRSTIGLQVMPTKAMLENYSWATSIFAIPADWLP